MQLDALYKMAGKTIEYTDQWDRYYVLLHFTDGDYIVLHGFDSGLSVVTQFERAGHGV